MTTRLGLVGARDESGWDVDTATDIRAFLAECLDQEEQTAQERRCITCGNRTKPILNRYSGVDGYTHDCGWQGVRCPGSVTGAEPPQLPDRILAEVAAKRRILARHVPAPLPPGHPLEGQMPEYCAAHAYRHDDGVVSYPVQLADCPELRDAVAPYAQRAGFNPAWTADRDRQHRRCAPPRPRRG